MRRSSVGAAVVVLMAMLVAPESAQARSSYCSPSGDFCTAVGRIDGRIVIRLSGFPFTGSIRVCVRPPTDRPSTCRNFRLRTVTGQLREIRVRWSAHFPDAGAGTYRVRFAQGPPTVSGQTLGPTLSFRIRR
jgi:hypothetical protein